MSCSAAPLPSCRSGKRAESCRYQATSIEPFATADRTLPLVPLRDMVVFPRMMAPFVVGRASSIAALESALASSEKRIFLAAQKDPKVDEPAAGDINETGVIASVVQSLKLPNGHIKVMVEGVVRGRIRAFTSGAGHLSVSVERLEPKPLGTSAAELVPYLSKVLSVFEQYAKLSHNLAFEGLLSSLKMDDPEAFADMLAGHLPTSIADGREAGAPRDGEPARAPPEAAGPAGDRDREDQHRSPDQQQGQEADGARAEGVLPQREDQGHSPGARQEGRQVRRARGAEGQDRKGRDAEGDEGEGARRDEAARGDAERLRRGDRLAQLHRLARERALEEGHARDEGHQARREDPERGPLRPREGEGAHPRVPRRPPARHGDEGLDPVLRGPAGRRQDVPGEEHREVAEPQVRAPVARRRARRGRGPRPPAHVHRRVPGPDHPAHEEGGHGESRVPARRGRQDVDGLPGRPVGGAPRGARPRAEPRLRGPLSRHGVRPVEGDVHRDGERRAPDSARAQGPDGDHPALGLHAEREGRDREAVPRAEADQGERPQDRRRPSSRTGPCTASSRSTRARRASATSSARSPPCAGRSPARSSARTPRRP